MKLEAFKIKNFKSIVDSGLTYLSVDNITAIIGQNESGKSAIIEALSSYYGGVINEMDIRHEDELPSIECTYKTSEAEMSEVFEGHVVPKSILSRFKDNGWSFTLRRTWETDLKNGKLSLVTPELTEDDFIISPKQETAEEENDGEDVPQEEPPVNAEKIVLSPDNLVSALFNKTPIIILFDSHEHILPSTIDIKSLSLNEPVEGKEAALNFLKLIGLSDLNFFDDRKNRAKIQHRIEKEAEKFTEAFRSFWRQEIGSNIAGPEIKGQKIAIKFGVDAHDNGEETGTGSYLYFIIGDGKQLLHPEQRSEGMRWYISFYLQLKAYSNNDEKPQVIVMDEPGRNLHATAQQDLLKLFEAEANEKISIVYTTHSPFMLAGSPYKIERIIAAQRSPHKDSDGYSHTQVMSGVELGAASKNTLFPLLVHLGMRLSDQEVIKKENNLITEEISAMYYLKAFLALTQSQANINIIAATGANNVPQLCYEFLGWGIKFSVLLDGDPKGQNIRDNLKHDLYMNDNEITNNNIYVMRDHYGIEDIFTQKDFKKYVIDDETVSYSGSNSKYVHDKELPKSVLAAKFMQKVKGGLVDMGDGSNGLSPTTRDNIKKVINAVNRLIASQHQL